MKQFEGKGIFEKNGKKERFAKIVGCESEKLARENILSQIGGKQRIKRVNIEITEVKEFKEKK
jgi:ribosomal protein L20A (L18A)